MGLGNWTEDSAETSPASTRPAESASADFAIRQPRRTIEDLVVPGFVRRRLEEAIELVRNHDTLFGQWNLRSIDPYRQGVAVNLYGPPGTGKTLATEALAAYLGRPFIEVNYAEIESRYVGDTPKNIVRCFAAARDHDAVLVFNEADSILGARLSNVTQSSDHSVNVSRAVMLTQLDQFVGTVLFTTNFPRNYDSAFLRRILTHVRFDLPDLETRRRLWEKLLPPELPRTDEVRPEKLAEVSDGLAGGDMVNVVLAAAAKAVRRSDDLRRVNLDDLRDEIALLRTARLDVGQHEPDPRELSALASAA